MKKLLLLPILFVFLLPSLASADEKPTPACSEALLRTYEYNSKWTHSSVGQTISTLYSTGCLDKLVSEWKPNKTICKKLASKTKNLIGNLGNKLSRAEARYNNSFRVSNKLLNKSNRLYREARGDKAKLRRSEALANKAQMVIDSSARNLFRVVGLLKPKADGVMFSLLDAQARGCSRYLPANRPVGPFEKLFKNELDLFEYAHQIEVDRFSDQQYGYNQF